jgi:hypothetical protein
MTFPKKPRATIPSRGRSTKSGKTGNKNLVSYMGIDKEIVRDPSKNHTLIIEEKTLMQLYINTNDTIYLIEFIAPDGKFRYMVREVKGGKKIVHAIRDGKEAAYHVYRRLEKKLTGWG